MINGGNIASDRDNAGCEFVKTLNLINRDDKKTQNPKSKGVSVRTSGWVKSGRVFSQYNNVF